ncbi:hypothetical protein AMAG_11394 [Allomyces macrogynus ATCC 38327]|uniref:Amino acid/peptide transporter (Peptide:H+ symporter) n=1 Tax=Allomyces macrogynus (strain ATCC 38327) TaxID=578462 RepID=A0A0L0SWY5_ALLM3|nr:hypothetical protein AMAG_11394 [Allomyces macrogynus ATCC 38327]|eukprot:KNE66920.1 hypothetical protein AMAG_11394 [Allomyces macrogynus ATCC 38327]
MGVEKIDSSVTLENAPDDALAHEYNTAGLSEKQIALLEKERRINADLDARIAKNPNAFPRAIYYILPNEFGERFTYYGLKAFLNRYLIFIGNEETSAKSMVHAWQMATYFFPLIGAAISDSYLGKYKTIVYLSLTYLVGNIILTITAIPALRTNWSVLIGLYLIGIGTGGIKPCVGPHGADQFLKIQADGLRRFFSYFYIAINAGAVLTGFATPALKDAFGCFGDAIGTGDDAEPVCYFAGYMLPTVVFAIVTALFIYGERYYRVVPPVGEFVPFHMFAVIGAAVAGWIGATKEDRAKKTFWQFGAGPYGEQFAEETGEFMRMLLMIFPFSFVWMVYDQQSTEWSDQYDRMDTYFGSMRLSPEVWIAIVNPIMVVLLVYLLSTFLYPWLERRGLAVTPLRRMVLGSMLVTVGFLLSGLLQSKVYDGYGGTIDEKTRLTDPKTCKGKCVHGAWQLPQWFVLSLGESLFSPTGSEFAYTQVGKSMRAFSTSFWLLMVSLGNFYVVAIEASLNSEANVENWTGKNLPKKYFLYTGISAAANVCLLVMAYFYKYKAGSSTSAKQ